MGTTLRIREVLDRQAVDLEHLHEREVRRFLRALDDARRDLRERLERVLVLGRGDNYTAQSVGMALAQAEAGAMQLRARLGEALDTAQAANGQRALDDLVAVLSRRDAAFRDAGPGLETQLLRRITEENGLLLHKYSIDRYGSQLVERIQQRLAAGIAAGETASVIIDRVVSANASVFAGMRHRAELIVRMELNRGYNDSHAAALQETSDTIDEPGTDDPLMRQADEFLDKRTHPISVAVDGKVTKIREPWRVPVAEVEAAARRIGKAAGGIVVPRIGSEYVGVYPMHLGERGRQVSVRLSWL